MKNLFVDYVWNLFNNDTILNNMINVFEKKTYISAIPKNKSMDENAGAFFAQYHMGIVTFLKE